MQQKLGKACGDMATLDIPSPHHALIRLSEPLIRTVLLQGMEDIMWGLDFLH